MIPRNNKKTNSKFENLREIEFILENTLA